MRCGRRRGPPPGPTPPLASLGTDPDLEGGCCPRPILPPADAYLLPLRFVCSLLNMFSKTFKLCKPRSGCCRRPDPAPTPEKGPQKKARLYEATFLVADFPISRLLPHGGGSRRPKVFSRRVGTPGLDRSLATRRLPRAPRRRVRGPHGVAGVSDRPLLCAAR